jgi:hypothetical protein
MNTETQNEKPNMKIETLIGDFGGGGITIHAIGISQARLPKTIGGIRSLARILARKNRPKPVRFRSDPHRRGRCMSGPTLSAAIMVALMGRINMD